MQLPRSRSPRPRHRRDRLDRGASTIEYALLVAAIAAVLVAVLFGLASIVRDAFSTADDCVTSGGTSESCPRPTS